MKVKVISLPYIFQVLYVLCFTRPRYQVSVSLRKILREDSVISVKLYSTSFFELFSNYLKKIILSSLRYILIESIVGKISIDDFLIA